MVVTDSWYPDAASNLAREVIHGTMPIAQELVGTSIRVLARRVDESGNVMRETSINFLSEIGGEPGGGVRERLLWWLFEGDAHSPPSRLASGGRASRGTMLPCMVIEAPNESRIPTATPTQLAT